MPDLIIDHDQESAGYKVTLPCNPNEFADFIGSLLSKGLSIEKNYTDVFVLDAADIRQLVILLSQRVNQNAGRLIAFTSKVYYSDRSSVSFNSPDDLFSHNEIKKIETTAVSLELVYLVHFPGKPAPAKQTIAIVFKPGRVVRHLGTYLKMNDSEITLQVNHSDKTWANDIVNLFNDFLAHHLYTPSKITLLWNRINKHVSTIAGFACFGVGLAGIALAYHFIATRIADGAKASISSVDTSLAFLVDRTYDPTMIYFVLGSVFYIGILIALSIFVSERLEKDNAIPIVSSLLFTEEDRRRVADRNKSSIYQLFELGVEILKGIAAGLIANAIFAGLWH